MNNEIYYNTETLNKMTDKLTYYTPELKEFHVGFNFQFEHPEKGWVEVAYPRFKFNPRDLGTEDLSKCRVKYLDKEDIESSLEGDAHFVYSCHTDGGYDSFSNNQGDAILHNVHNHRCVISIFDEKRREAHTAFVGTIKNKSELKKLFKQLGIQTK